MEIDRHLFPTLRYGAKKAQAWPLISVFPTSVELEIGLVMLSIVQTEQEYYDMGLILRRQNSRPYEYR
jgi:hypothetical protein